MKKSCIMMMALMLLQTLAVAQWTKGRTGVLTYHCDGCVGISDLRVGETAVSMDGCVMADITLCDSLSCPVAQWHKMPLGEASDSAAVLHRFISRRQGFVEMLVYRPTEWDPRQLETFTYIVPTIKTINKLTN